MDQNEPPANTMSGCDPVILGLERKLDVLRAQLAASCAGDDPGEAGVKTWSRLEGQAQRIAQLEQDNAELGRQLAEALAQSTAMSNRLERAREEIQIGQRTNISLGRAVSTALSFNHEKLPSETTEPAASVTDTGPSPEALLLNAMQNSTSWRITAPLRAVTMLFRQFRRGTPG